MERVYDYDAMRRMREDGMAVEDIAARLGCSGSTVERALREMGCSTGPYRIRVERERLLELWQQGLTLVQIGIELGCSASTVSTMVKRERMPRRPAIRKEAENDPTPAEIAERARECRERHYAQRRAEKEENVRTKIWKWDQA